MQRSQQACTPAKEAQTTTQRVCTSAPPTRLLVGSQHCRSSLFDDVNHHSITVRVPVYSKIELVPLSTLHTRAVRPAVLRSARAPEAGSAPVGLECRSAASECLSSATQQGRSGAARCIEAPPTASCTSSPVASLSRLPWPAQSAQQGVPALRRVQLCRQPCRSAFLHHWTCSLP